LSTLFSKKCENKKPRFKAGNIKKTPNAGYQTGNQKKVVQ
jgi:hypothetical protein